MPQPPPSDLPNAYLAADREDLWEEVRRSQAMVATFNRLAGSDPDAARRTLGRLFGRIGERVEVRAPIACDLGRNITVGDDTFINSGLTALDIAPVTIGEACNIGPNVSLVTPVHPVEPGPRLAGWEGADPVTVCDNVWIGAGAVILPGVTVGDGAVIGAGAVVTGDVPASQIAVGNPARVIRATGRPRRPGITTALVTCPAGMAGDLAGSLVKSGNAACVNVIDRVRSVYRHRGEIERSDEALLVIKTTRERIADLENQLRDIHPYEVHELICLPVEAGSEPYLDWLAGSVGPDETDRSQ